MNILHITTFLQGGAGRIIKDIAFHQKENGNNVYIITSKTEEVGYCNYEEYIDEFNKKNIPVFFFDSTFKRDIYLNLNVAKELKNIIKENHIDIIHAHAAVPAMIGVIARSGLDRDYIPVIQTMHGWGTNKNLEHENMDITIMNSLDKVITVSKSDRDFLITKGLNSVKLTTIYNGINEENVVDLDDDSIIEILKNKKKEGYIILGCIGTVCKRKNQELLVESLKHLVKKKKIFCAFIGEGDFLKTLENKVKFYKLEHNIRFCGYRNNASKYFRYFDFFVIPSLSEGFGLVIVEAFKENVPAIVSDIDVFKELVEDEKTGYLFKSNDEGALVRTILKVLNKNSDEISIIKENGYGKFKEQFTLYNMVYNYDEIYNEIKANSKK